MKSTDYDLRPLDLILGEPQSSPRERWQAEHDAWEQEQRELNRRLVAARKGS